ncbi:hypothetical protein NLJ89_g2446 [Agrocybe chaxingu]|uniref:Signal peptidase complex catalytic subunit SEC11 n=1 Tax=Agrocybe chaxingu TaxID=84603 RepID=A0A9W8K7A6_9AGAR|nr:hypothetical protein NLJ89_g2446 [Agrocybe chaxingu]
MGFNRRPEPSIRKLLLHALSFSTALASTVALYGALQVLTNTDTPIVVVLSGSMEPAFHRGDLLFLTNSPHERYITGDIIVYKVPDQLIPIVHRILKTHEKPLDFSSASTRTSYHADSAPVPDQFILTKGDNNPEDDIVLYKGMDWLQRKHVVGKVKGFMPYIGYATIAMNDVPNIKYGLLGIMLLSAVFF